MTTAAPEKVAPVKGKKKKPKNAFEKELGINGKAEREKRESGGGGGGGGEGGGARDKKTVRGGSAGKGKSAFGDKRGAKAGKRT